MNTIDRLKVADAAVKMLNDGKLENLANFIFEAVFDVRRIVDNRAFNPDTNPKLDTASLAVGFVKISYDNRRPRFSLYFETTQGQDESNAFGDWT